MAQYAIAFDLDTKAMREAGLNKSQRTTIYQTEIPTALESCGFTRHPQGSLYHTDSAQNAMTAIMKLPGVLKKDAPQFCRFVKRVHLFRMDEWSDITDMVADRAAVGPPDAEEEAEEAETADA